MCLDWVTPDGGDQSASRGFYLLTSTAAATESSRGDSTGRHRRADDVRHSAETDTIDRIRLDSYIGRTRHIRTHLTCHSVTRGPGSIPCAAQRALFTLPAGIPVGPSRPPVRSQISARFNRLKGWRSAVMRHVPRPPLMWMALLGIIGTEI